MTRAWTVREMVTDDFDAVRTLYRATWGYNRPLGYDHWRYLETPQGICPTALAVDGERLAGLYTVWPTWMRVGNEIVAGAQSMDTMTHPDYRGQGIFTELALACYEIAARRSFEVLYGFPNPLSYPGFVRRLNWDHVRDVTHWVRPILPSRHPKIPRSFKPLADQLPRLLPVGSAAGYELVVGRPADKAIERLVERWNMQTPGCAVSREARWWSWRYSPAAANRYEWISAYRAGNLCATGIWGIREESWGPQADHRAHLTELLGEEASALSAVLASIIGRVRGHGAMLLETVSNVPTVVRALKRAGFFAHRQMPLIARALTSRNLDANIHDASSWHVMGGDVDTF